MLKGDFTSFIHLNAFTKFRYYHSMCEKVEKYPWWFRRELMSDELPQVICISASWSKRLQV